MTELSLRQAARIRLAGALSGQGFHGALRRIADDQMDAFDRKIEHLPPRQRLKAIEREQRELAAQAGLGELLKGHPPDVQRKALLQAQTLTEKEIARRRDDVRWDGLHTLAGSEKERGGTFDTFMAKLTKLAREVPTPPLTSALNVEAATMGWAHFVWSTVPGYEVDDGSEALTALGELLTVTKDPTLRRVFSSFSGAKERMLPIPEAVEDYLRFAHEWRQNSYARLEVGHKLAASLCLTDIPEDLVVQYPWTAWSLIVPDGLLGELARVWIHRSLHDATRHRMILIDRTGHQFAHSDPTFMEMVAALVRGCALALSNPEDFRKDRQHRPTARSSKHRSGGAPDLGQARFMLSAAVSVDLRDHVREALSGKKRGGGSPTVQFLVRGHWRQQAHGPARSLRKTLWIQPFWKGPEESRVLLRTYKAEDGQ